MSTVDSPGPGTARAISPAAEPPHAGHRATPRRALRTAALILGLACVPGYLAWTGPGDPAGLAIAALTRFGEEHELRSDGGSILDALITFFYRVRTLDGFRAVYARTFVWMIPAIALTTWGLAGLVRAAWVHRALARLTRHATVLVGLAALTASLGTHLIASRVYEYHAITVGDECSYRFQARLFAAGQWFAPAPPAGEALRNRAFVADDRWYGIGFGGHPLALTPGVLLGNIYLMPTLFAGVNVILIFLLVRELFDRSAALLAAGMFALSPLMLFYHASLLPESTSLVLLLLFLLLLARAAKRRSAAAYVPAAIAMALALATRPQTFCPLALPIGVWILLRRDRTWRTRLRPVWVLAAGGALGVFALFTYAHLVSGDPFGAHLSPGYHQDEVGGTYELGIEDVSEFTTNSAHLIVTLLKMNFMLLGWPVSLVVIYLWFRRPGKNRWELLLFACIAGVFWFYWMYADQLEQYFVEAGALMIVLGALGVVSAYRGGPASPPGTPGRHAVVCFVIAGYVFGAASVWPFRTAYFRDRSAHERRILAPVREAGLHNAIVVLDGLDHEHRNVVGLNSPALDDDVLFAKVRRTGQIPDVVRHFPERTPYRMYRQGQDGAFRIAPWPDDHAQAVADELAQAPRQGVD